jgi:HK97 family phage major capsid protein
MFRDSQLNAINTALATGSGTGEPTGIVTALTGGAQEISSASTDAYAIADVYAVYDNQSARYRDGSTWAMNALTMTLTRQFGTADGHSFLAHPDASNRLNLLGQPVVFNSSMDGTVTAPAENYLIVFGDFANFVVAVRQPLVVEFIPHLFATGANRPSGQRGWYAWSRVGSDSVADGAFTLLNCT